MEKTFIDYYLLGNYDKIVHYHKIECKNILKFTKTYY